MRFFIALLFLLLPIKGPAYNEARIRVVVLDTGILREKARSLPLCTAGHMDFVNFESYFDKSGINHGTNVSALIAGAGRDVCQVIFKVFPTTTMRPYIMALKYIAQNSYKFDIVHMSLAGVGPSKEEIALIKEILDNGVQIVAAAGNYGIDFKKQGCGVYPACADSRIHVIGGTNKTSNRGPQVDHIRQGIDVTAAGIRMSGTSQAAAIFTSELAFKLAQDRSRVK